MMTVRDTNLTRESGATVTGSISSVSRAERNRLVRMQANTAVGPQHWLEFGYDWQGRRISKKVGPIGSGTATNEVRFAYDGWNLIATLNSQLSTLSCFVWGLDLSGSLQGAGGVGGLLAVQSADLGTQNFVAFDGNGNVAALLNAADSSTVAQYEYGPFGEVVRETGPMAKVNPFRFSTKYQDDETDLLYYGYRYYSDLTGKWLSRDPAEESGGNNLYSFNFSNPINRIDTLGDVSGGWDNNAFHIHDGDLTYGVRPSGTGYEVFANPTHPGGFDQEKAAASFRKFLSTERGVKQFQSMIGTMHAPNSSYGSAWNALPDQRDLIRGMGRNSWRALKAVGKVAGIVAIVGALQASSQAATVAENYGRALERGDTPMADLEAIEIALLILEGTGNYFMGYLALDVLLE